MTDISTQHWSQLNSDAKRIDWDDAGKMQEDLQSAAELAKQTKQVLAYCSMNLETVWHGTDVGKVKELLEEYEAAYDAIAVGIEETRQRIIGVKQVWSRAVQSGK